MKISMFQLTELHYINDELKILKHNLQLPCFQYHSMQCPPSVDSAENNSQTQHLLYKKWKPGAQVSCIVKDTNPL